MDRVVAPPASRNSPCPCGSGRRYKDCHGSLGSAPAGPAALAPLRSTYRAPGAEWAHLDVADRDACGELMEDALRHQTSGRLDQAARGYRDVLSRAPDTHDALHMLGVIELERQDLEEAERLIRAALALRPPYATIQHNLRLVEDAHVARMRAQPEQLAERALPILSELAFARRERSSNLPTLPHPVSTAIHLIGRVTGDDDDAWLLRRLCQLLGREQNVWTTDVDAPAAIAGVRVRAIDGTVGALPRGGVHVYVGLDVECSDWIARASADRIIAVPVAAAPALCLDQLRVLAQDGARRVELALISPSMSRRFGNGHHAIAPPIEALDAAPAAHDASSAGDPAAWPLGISGQNRRSVTEPTDVAFVRSLVAATGSLHVHDPGRMRFALGADARVRSLARDERSLAAFLSSLRCYVHRVEHWWDEGLARDMFAAMAVGVPVLCPRSSLYADYIDDGVDGLLYGSSEEALARIARLRRESGWAAAVGRASRATAARLFDPKAITRAWRELLQGDARPARWPLIDAPAAEPATRAVS